MDVVWFKYLLLFTALVSIGLFIGCTSADPLCEEKLSGEWTFDANGFLFDLDLHEGIDGQLKGVLKPLVKEAETTTMEGEHGLCDIKLSRIDNGRVVQQFVGTGRRSGHHLVISGTFADQQYRAGWAAVKKDISIDEQVPINHLPCLLFEEGKLPGIPIGWGY